MDERKKDAGTIQALLDRLNKQRLPRLLAMQQKVDGGGLLDDVDMRFLQTVKKDAGEGLTKLRAEEGEACEGVPVPAGGACVL